MYRAPLSMYRISQTTLNLLLDVQPRPSCSANCVYMQSAMTGLSGRKASKERGNLSDQHSESRLCGFEERTSQPCESIEVHSESWWACDQT